MRELEALGERVREARRRRGLTLKELAEESGLSLRFLSDLERGKGNISVVRLLSVARALQATMQELIAPLDDAMEPKRSPVLALIGLRGAGKSTIGKRAAERIGVPFIELDSDIEASAGMPLAQIFEMYGESYYRRLERDVLLRVLEASKDGAVVATGGGIVTNLECWPMLKRHAQTIWLRAKPDDHYRRVVAQGDLRPMKNRPSAMAELRALLASRADAYAKADHVIDTSTTGLEGAVDRVVEAGRDTAVRAERDPRAARPVMRNKARSRRHRTEAAKLAP
jgi:XRE family aerobic/anaerobic benzoate catabolism transcriptional regulator